MPYRRLQGLKKSSFVSKPSYRILAEGKIEDLVELSEERLFNVIKEILTLYAVDWWHFGRANDLLSSKWLQFNLGEPYRLHFQRVRKATVKVGRAHCWVLVVERVFLSKINRCAPCHNLFHIKIKYCHSLSKKFSFKLEWQH